MFDAYTIVIAGPQSSGKSTLFNYLMGKYPQYNFLPEINPYTFIKKIQTIHKKMDSLDIQNLIYKEDFIRTKQLIKTRNVSVVETGIFNVIYMHNIAGEKAATNQMESYLAIYKKINPFIIFIDTKPQISWRRRKAEYQERIGTKTNSEFKEIMVFYKNRIFKLYPLWLHYYEYMPFKKVMIKNSYKNEKDFIAEALTKIESIL